MAANATLHVNISSLGARISALPVTFPRPAQAASLQLHQISEEIGMSFINELQSGKLIDTYNFLGETVLTIRSRRENRN